MGVFILKGENMKHSEIVAAINATNGWIRGTIETELGPWFKIKRLKIVVYQVNIIQLLHMDLKTLLLFTGLSPKLISKVPTGYRIVQFRQLMSALIREASF